MPLMVVFVGGSLAWWGSTRETLRMQAIEQQVRAIIQGVAEGRDMTGRLNRDNPFIEQHVLERLAKLAPNPKEAEVISVKVTPGDTAAERAGSAATKATHTVILHIGEDELLALRVQCDDPTQPATVLGYVEVAQR